MDFLNRAALIVRPKRRYKEWADSLPTGGEDPIFDLDEARLEPAVYLVAAEPENGLEDLIDEYAGEIFEAQLELWHLDEADWPVNRSAHVFRDWFDVTLADLVADLDPEAPLDVDPEAADEAADMIDVLQGDGSGSLNCAWCADAIDPDATILTLRLTGERQPQPQPAVMEIGIAGRRAKAVVPSDESPAGREGVIALVMFCGEDCAQAFSDAWSKERGAMLS
jgi:hypothetical protein